MMQRRLLLAKRLLTPDGVLIIMIDGEEVHRLALLLEQLFPHALNQMITVVTNPSRTKGHTFASVAEYALYSFADNCARVTEFSDDLLSAPADTGNKPLAQTKNIELAQTRGPGTNDRPRDRPGLVFPIGINESGHVVAVGQTLRDRFDTRYIRDHPEKVDSWQPDPNEQLTGAAKLIWPRKKTGSLRPWSLGPGTVMQYAHEGRIFANASHTSFLHLSDDQWQKVNDGVYRMLASNKSTVPQLITTASTMKQRGTVWWRSRHNIRHHGTNLVARLLGEKRFEYPKSMYATRDAIASVTIDRPDAVILDFFAGSGTTLHAVAALNASDGGRRQCVLVTNNEVGSKEQARLDNAGHRPGDAAWESQGVFHHVTRPRVEAALSGRTPNGKRVAGKYLPPLYQRDMADGLPATAAFLRLKCLDPERLELGETFDELHPLLWVASGAYGPCPATLLPSERRDQPGWLVPGDGVIQNGCHYAILLRTSRLTGFCDRLTNDPNVSHVWVDAFSEGEVKDVESEIHTKVRANIQVARLHRDVLDYFKTQATRES